MKKLSFVVACAAIFTAGLTLVSKNIVAVEGGKTKEYKCEIIGVPTGETITRILNERVAQGWKFSFSYGNGGFCFEK